ncbi:hypothetical protein A4X09_0g4028 [Tilletia walkeri]|uniref:Calpain catalytic domain-containing protein n=1 Tax=Tilletia walkeri TaxID=117179 RepID=A0A8X7N883_9BASI|nr:hypothetical protein A4X09_0g4028 [Tilletia walkeri]
MVPVDHLILQTSHFHARLAIVLLSFSNERMTSNLAREWALKLTQAQDGTNEAARLEFAKDYSTAFSTYVRTGETYLWLIRHFDRRQRAGSSEGDDELKARLRKAASKVLERAELIKSLRKDIVVPPRDILSPDAQAAILYRSSTIGALSYPLWDAAAVSAFDGLQASSEDQPALASSHLQRSAQFRRAAETAGSPQLINYDSPLRGRDIVQDVVTDCSFVAALQVAAEYDRRWSSKIATAALHPRDAQDQACPNQGGKYAVKLHFNGGARRVVVDDKLPCFPDGTLIGVAAVRNDQFWPALVEKAFLKVMGGYDFPGSNSAADLHTLTGWLPEQVLLQQAGFRREQTWHSLHTAFVNGRCILTVGTGANALSRPRDKRWRWLSPAHNYAVLDVREHEGLREVLVVNSWRRAPSAIDADLSDQTEALNLQVVPSPSQVRDDEVHVLSWEDICMRFDTIHVNWRLSDFAHSETVHCAWDSRNEQLGLSQNMQLQILFDWSARKEGESTDGPSNATGDDSEELWLHLNRHMTGSSEPESALIAVHAFNHTDGRKLYQLTDREQMGAFTDSSHALHKMRIRPDCQAVTVIASQYGVNCETSFSLSAYGPVPMTIRALPRAYANRITTSGSWSGRSAGGNLAQPTFGFNPQYVLEIEDSGSNMTSDASLLIMAETARMVPLQVMLVHSGGGMRVEQVEEPEVIMSSGVYTHAVAIAERRADGSAVASAGSIKSSTRSPLLRRRNGVPPGKYTLIVSTFAPGVEGDFFLTIESSHRLAAIRPIPQEGAGMFHRALRGQWSIERGTAAGGPTGGLYCQNPCWKLAIPAGGATIQMRLRLDTNDVSISSRLPFKPNSGPAPDAPGGTGQQTRPPLNLAIFRLESRSVGDEERRRDAGLDERSADSKISITAVQAPVLPKASEVTSSGPYADRLHGVAIGRQHLEAGEYVLVASTFNTCQEASFVVEVWSETGLEVR